MNSSPSRYETSPDTAPAGAETSIDLAPYRSIGGETIEQQEADIHSVLREYAMDHRVEVVRVGDSGFAILGLPESSMGGTAVASRTTYNPEWWQPSAKGTEPVGLIDLDDVLVDYSGAKNFRYENFVPAVQQAGVDNDTAPDVARDLMEATNTFSRWHEEGKQEKVYHDLAHELSLGWALQQLKVGVPVDNIVAGLKRIKDGEQKDMPFYFDGDRLVCEDPSSLITDETQEIVAPMLRPYLFADTVRDSQLLERNGAHLSLLTRGIPRFQLPKAMKKIYQIVRARSPYGVISEERKWPYRNILLTNDSKGVFMHDLYELSENDPRIKEEFFSDKPHALFALDDSPGELDSIRDAAELIESGSGAIVGTIPSLQPRTKNSGSWQGRSARHILRRMTESGHHEPYVAGRPHLGELSSLAAVLGRSIAKILETAPDERNDIIRAQVDFFTKLADRYPETDPEDTLWIAPRKSLTRAGPRHR